MKQNQKDREKHGHVGKKGSCQCTLKRCKWTQSIKFFIYGMDIWDCVLLMI